MNKELYRATIVPAPKSRDGETPGLVLVTEESNGFAVWYSDVDGDELIRFYRYGRDQAIERGVSEAAVRRDAFAFDGQQASA
jgi:hypothetical protein